MARSDTARGIVIGLGIGITVGVSALLPARAGGGSGVPGQGDRVAPGPLP